jgi:hypothetical protein
LCWLRSRFGNRYLGAFDRLAIFVDHRHGYVRDICLLLAGRKPAGKPTPKPTYEYCPAQTRQAGLHPPGAVATPHEELPEPAQNTLPCGKYSAGKFVTNQTWEYTVPPVRRRDA